MRLGIRDGVGENGRTVEDNTSKQRRPTYYESFPQFQPEICVILRICVSQRLVEAMKNTLGLYHNSP